MAPCPQLSVVIPTLGRTEPLKETLRGLLTQGEVEWECLIIAQGELKTSPLFQLFGSRDHRLRLFHCSEPNASLARNVGLWESYAPIVLFLDDDLLIRNESFLCAHLANYTEPETSGVFGQVLSPDGSVRCTRHRLSQDPATGWLYFPFNYGERCRIRCGGAGNLSVRRQWAISVGGMDARYEKGAHREESDFCLRYTEKYGDLLFDPSASVIHLGAVASGCRTWGNNKGLHPIHHVSGEWYFILKNLANRRIRGMELPHHLLQLALRQVWNQENRWRPLRVLRAARRSMQGYAQAREMQVLGPRYLSDDLRGYYSTLRTPN